MQLLQKSVISAAVLVALTACGGSDNKNQAPTADNIQLTAGKTWLPVQGSFKGFDIDGDSLQLTAIRQHGNLINAQNGVYHLAAGQLTVQGLNFSYLPLAASADSFSYTLSDGELSASATVNIPAAASDPLLAQQWHLHNSGQKAYALGDGLREYLLQSWTSQGLTPDEAKKAIATRFTQWERVLVPGQDMNVQGALAQGVTGANTIAVVVDSGLELAHEDLAANILPNRSLNFIKTASNPTDPTNLTIPDPRNANTIGDHGTSVAGLIAAEGWNGKGGRGVAPEAKLIGMNFLAEQSLLSYTLSHGLPGSGIVPSEPVAVMNRSYGATHPGATAFDPYAEAVQEYAISELRDGKGVVNVKSSGNSFLRGAAALDNNFCAVAGANALGLSCYNANMEVAQTTSYYFSVGAVNSDGKHTSYSTAGANLLLAAPAGEFGDTAPAMVTTDQMTCLKGYASFAKAENNDLGLGAGGSELVFPFNTPGHPDNPSCNYTNTFNGTSSAAPNTSGVVALLLSANPALSYRDVRHILLSTASQVDSSNKAVSLKLSDGDFVAHPGWVKNQAGFAHNNYYGFGRPDAGKAVAMAKTYSSKLGAFKVSPWQGAGVYSQTAQPLGLTIPDNSVAGASIELNVSDEMTLEAVQFRFSVTNSEMTSGTYDTETRRWNKEYQTTAGADLAIEVTSPQGTRSVLLSSKQALLMPARLANGSLQQGYILRDTVFLSHAFYGEKAKGSWKIRLLDANGNDISATGGILNVKGYRNNTALSVVDGVAIRVLGH